MIQCHAITDVGKRRSQNEDNYLCDPETGLFAVADGVGGRAHGEVASALTITSFQECKTKIKKQIHHFSQNPNQQSKNLVLDCIDEQIQLASNRVFEAAEKEGYHGMTTTLVLAAAGAGTLFIAHAGDSRAYIFRNKRLRQLTEDHTMVNELINSGKITPEQAAKSPFKNVIVRAVGLQPSVKPDVAAIEILPGDRILLCSDGLTDPVPDDLIEKILADNSAEQSSKKLIEAALDAGGPDNVSVVVLDPDASSQKKAAIARAKILEQFVLFKDLPYHGLVRASRIVEEITVKPGQVVVKQDTEGQFLYIVIEGRYKVSQNGIELSVLEPGHHFGELSLVDFKPRSAEVVAIDGGSLLAISRKGLDYFCKREPELGNQILWKLMQTISHRLRECNLKYTKKK